MSAPLLRLVWPGYERPTAQDNATLAREVRADLLAGLISRRTAVRMAAERYAIADVDAYETAGARGPCASV